MKEVEKEKDFLLQGLELVDQARDWYHQQFLHLQERQKQLCRIKAPGVSPCNLFAFSRVSV